MSQPGELVVVLGGNGSGKTTLLRCITRTLKPSSGEVWLGDTDLCALEGEKLRRARLDAGDDLATGRAWSAAAAYSDQRRKRRARPPFHVADGVRRPAALRSSMRRAAILPRSGSPPRRRSAPARCRAARRSVSRSRARWRSGRACCWPTSRSPASIRKRRKRSCACCRSWLARSNLAVLCVLHQIELAYAYADRVVGIRDGRMAFQFAARAKFRATRCAGSISARRHERRRRAGRNERHRWLARRLRTLGRRGRHRRPLRR